MNNILPSVLFKCGFITANRREPHAAAYYGLLHYPKQDVVFSSSKSVIFLSVVISLDFLLFSETSSSSGVLPQDRFRFHSPV